METTWKCAKCGAGAAVEIMGLSTPFVFCCGLYQWDCSECAEPLSSPNGAEVGALCGRGYCKHDDSDYCEFLDYYTPFDLTAGDNQYGEDLWYEQ